MGESTANWGEYTARVKVGITSSCLIYVSLGIFLVIFSYDELSGCPITETKRILFRFLDLPFSGELGSPGALCWVLVSPNGTHDVPSRSPGFVHFPRWKHPGTQTHPNVSLGIQSPNVRWWARGVQSPPKRKVFRFHYHSQKVIGSLGYMSIKHYEFTMFFFFWIINIIKWLFQQRYLLITVFFMTCTEEINRRMLPTMMLSTRNSWKSPLSSTLASLPCKGIGME